MPRSLPDPRVLQTLYSWARRLKSPRRGAKQRGLGLEFGAYRPYAPGEDIRRLDWVIYARLERLMVKLTEDLPDPRAHIVIDNQPRLGCGYPKLIDRACQLAAGLSAVALGRGARVRLVDAEGRSHGPDFQGGQQFARINRALTELDLSTTGSLAKVSERLSRRARSQVLVLSDGLGELESSLKAYRALRHSGHELLVIHVWPQYEWSPERFEGRRTMTFELSVPGDLKSQRRSLSWPDFLELSQRRLAFLDDAEQALEKHHIRVVRVDSESSVTEAIRALLSAPTGPGSKSKNATLRKASGDQNQLANSPGL